MDCSPQGSSLHGTSQARILEWVAISFSRGSSWPRDQTHICCVSYIGRQTFLPLSYQGSPKIYWKTKYKLTCSNFHFSVSTRETLDDSVKPDFLQVHQTKLSFTKSISKFKLVHHQNHLWLTSRESEELIDPHNTVKAVTHKI